MNYNDKFYLTPLSKLLSLILKQIDKGEVLGLTKELFFKPQSDDFFKIKYLGKKIDSPVGVAAGPQTQLAQNIVVSWLAGARFIELKTVQTLDEIEVLKPCIDMQDEGYNCEWSQELKIKQAFDEYLNAWIIIHILADKFEFESIGTIFNMSVGYDLAGIMNKNVQWFFDKMYNAPAELEKKLSEIENIYPKVRKLDIPAQITDNITLSTMHGCPPEEIEQIAKYLISERKLKTTIKLNPTLLGSENLRKILDNSGFNTNVPAEAFEHDLKFEDAKGIIERMQKLADENDTFFGIKLTNTLESIDNKDIFSDANEMMYMSGKALHPISINTAKKIQTEFNGNLHISFSGGIDCFNIVDTIACGLKPVTVSTDLLKPGGYGRLHQYIENLRKAGKNSKSLSDFINIYAKNQFNTTNLNALENLKNYAEAVLKNQDYKKQSYSEPTIKTNRVLHKFDCISAPCQDTCPTEQNVPQYMYFTQTGESKKALKTIFDDNPFPTVTGYVCDHTCQQKCTRINYDNSLNIRDIKRYISESASFVKPHIEQQKNTAKVAIIGAGPGGLSAAYFLVTHGFEVQIFEKNNKPGGMISNAIPSFRLPDKQIDIDISHITDLGVKINYQYEINVENFDEIRTNFEYIFVSPGAQSSLKIELPNIDAEGVYDPLDFFYKIRNEKEINIGKKVSIIGGGNTAMDAARIAKRLVGKNGEVYILYRRSKEQMPADYHEIQEALDENIIFIEQVEPESIITKNSKVSGIELFKTKLVKSDEGKRPRPVRIPESGYTLELDTIIPTIGQENNFDFLSEKDFKNREIPFTRFDNIFIGGDAVRGAASAIKAIADGKKTAFEIIKRKNSEFEPKLFTYKKDISITELKIKKAKRIKAINQNETSLDNRNNFNLIAQTYTPEQAKAEADRCLVCDELCDVCVSVCPNLANQSYNIEPFAVDFEKIVSKNGKYKIVFDKKLEIKQNRQTYNIADWCNECGNCATFCPTSGKPYLDKPKVHLSLESFNQSPFGYYLEQNNDHKFVKYKNENQISTLKIYQNQIVFENDEINIKFEKNFKITEFSVKKEQTEISLSATFAI